MSSASGYLLSIIIPTYNNAEFITETLSSLHKNISEDVEIIIINDGSTDLTEARIKAFCREKNSHNIKYIFQENQGVATTRNVGLAHATGKYIGFVDSDDLVSPDYFSVLLPKLKDEKYDMIEFNFTRDINKLENGAHAISEREIVRSDDNFSHLTQVFRAGQWHLVTKIFHHKIIGDDRFEDNHRYEDMIFSPFQYFKCNKILNLDSNLYYYRVNGKSITENVVAGDAESVFFAMRKMSNHIRNDSKKRTVATLMIVNCFMEGRKLLRKQKGFYGYDKNMLTDIHNALQYCDLGVVNKKSLNKMRYTSIDLFISKTKYLALYLCKRNKKKG